MKINASTNCWLVFKISISRTSHLYIAEDLYPLDQLLTTQNDLYSMVSEDSTKQISMHVWIVQVGHSNVNRIEDLTQLLKSTRLRLDSHVFGFYEGWYKITDRILIV